jgi:hypothetical protein
LALKPGDSSLSEISQGIYGDYDEPFQTFLATGLYPVSSNRFEFQRTEEAELEVSQPEGVITFDLLGYQRNRGFQPIKSKTLNVSSASTPIDSWDETWDHPWDETEVITGAEAESSVKRYLRVRKELNSVQWNISTNSLRARYILRTLQTWGRATNAGKPRSWRL